MHFHQNGNCMEMSVDEKIKPKEELQVEASVCIKQIATSKLGYTEERIKEITRRYIRYKNEIMKWYEEDIMFRHTVLFKDGASAYDVSSSFSIVYS